VLYTTVDSPIGELLLLGDGHALHGLWMRDGRAGAVVAGPGWERASGPFEDVRVQLAEYFAGRRLAFDLPLAMAGTPLQRRVWRALLDIPYGETTTYGELARRVKPAGGALAARAVGMANGRNPIAVVVPCHRVVGADGTLTGYGGGLERKRFLLDLEAGTLARRAAS
jgi:methylated-DNA-[protein]-cysteine S-methyltransferase